MTKLIYTSKIHSNQSISCLFTEEYQLVIANLKNPKAFIDSSRTIHNVSKNLEDCNPTKKRRVFDDMIVDIESNKKLSPIVTKLFLRGRIFQYSIFRLFLFFYSCFSFPLISKCLTL